MTVYRNPTSPFWDFPRPKIGSFSATRSVRQAEIKNHPLLISTFISLIASQILTSGSSVSKVSFWKGVSRSGSGELFVCSRMTLGVFKILYQGRCIYSGTSYPQRTLFCSQSCSELLAIILSWAFLKFETFRVFEAWRVYITDSVRTSNPPSISPSIHRSNPAAPRRPDIQTI